MRYCLVDQITDWTSGHSIAGVKNVTMSDDVLEFHFPKNPVLPGVLLIEAMVQLAGWMEAVSSGFKTWVLLSAVNLCRFYGFSLPGDQVHLEVTCLKQDGNKKSFRGLGRINKNKIITIEFQGDLVPLEELEDPVEHKKLFDRLKRDFSRSND